MRKKEIIFAFAFFLFVFLSFCVYAQPPLQTNINTANGFQIYYPDYESVRQNQPFNLSIHLSNISDGYPINTTLVECYIHIYNNTGNEICDGTFYEDVNTLDFTYFLTEGNFSNVGINSFYIYCYNETIGLGGEVSGIFEVTPTGNLQTEAQGIAGASYLFLFIFLTIFFVIVGLKLTDGDMWPMGIFFLALSMFLIVYDFWLGYEYQLKYVGLDGSTAIPEMFFWIITFLAVVGIWILIVVAIKKIPKLIEYLKYKKEQSEDPYSEDY